MAIFAAKSGSVSLEGLLSNVETSGAPNDGDMLVWDNELQLFIIQAPTDGSQAVTQIDTAGIDPYTIAGNIASGVLTFKEIVAGSGISLSQDDTSLVINAQLSDFNASVPDSYRITIDNDNSGDARFEIYTSISSASTPISITFAPTVSPPLIIDDIYTGVESDKGYFETQDGLDFVGAGFAAGQFIDVEDAVYQGGQWQIESVTTTGTSPVISRITIATNFSNINGLGGPKDNVKFIQVELFASDTTTLQAVTEDFGPAGHNFQEDQVLTLSGSRDETFDGTYSIVSVTSKGANPTDYSEIEIQASTPLPSTGNIVPDNEIVPALKLDIGAWEVATGFYVSKNGSVTLGAEPTNNNHAATKLYVDQVVGNDGTENLFVIGGNTIVRGLDETNAVNNVTISNSETGLPVEIAAEGLDTDIDINIVAKGAGIVRILPDLHIGSNSTIITDTDVTAATINATTINTTTIVTETIQTTSAFTSLGIQDNANSISLVLESVPNAINWIEIQNNNVGSPPILTVNGFDTDAGLDIRGKGIGIVTIYDPDLRGVPTAPTAVADTNTTQIATTAYVQTELGTITANAITEGDSNITITDAGAGSAVVTIDTETIATFDVNNLTVAKGLVVTGNLTVNGTTSTISTTNTVITDAIVELANGTTGTPSNDAGTVVERGDSDNVFWGWDEATDQFTIGTGSFTGASTGALTTVDANLRAATITASTGFSGDLTGNADTATAWATTRTIGMSGDVSSDAVNIDGSGNVTITNTVVANDSHTHDMENLTGTAYAAGSGASLTSLTAANISTGNLVSGVYQYAVADAQAKSYKVSFLDTTLDASGNFQQLFESGTSEFTYNPSTNILTAGTFNGSATLTGVPTAPTADADTNTTQIATTAYVQTELGAISANAITEGNSNITVSDAGSGTITVTVDAGNILDYSASGVRMGAANARVTTIYDTDTLSEDSATALATQQSIKAYVDANSAAFAETLALLGI